MTCFQLQKRHFLIKIQPPVIDLTTIQANPASSQRRTLRYPWKRGAMKAASLVHLLNRFISSALLSQARHRKPYPRPGAKRDQALSIVHHVSCVFHLHFCRLGERKLEHKNRSQACCMTLELMENRKSTNKCGR